MFYDRESHRIEDLEDLGALAKLLPKAYPQPSIRRTRLLSFLAVENVEIYDFYTKTYLGDWDEDSFDFAGAEDAVIDTLDRHFRMHFSLKRKAR